MVSADSNQKPTDYPAQWTSLRNACLGFRTIKARGPVRDRRSLHTREEGIPFDSPKAIPLSARPQADVFSTGYCPPLESFEAVRGAQAGIAALLSLLSLDIAGLFSERTGIRGGAPDGPQACRSPVIG